ncbi:ser/Thr protein phosphatase [Microsporum canis CBS 113480]|uniref:Ser/Thr protein phosphatase n=1 Tax=Arthroderma otae (strain ATCC MYA-4605 / CBS 113480) TaxID=554155 RepID=C5FUS6_ARTOC|nr:ser/Thr protein phosphatase [Microsporum canis CBS 113480]EEQ33660.1 ser/Thr protein phosphatase [Microsporum canis CBS 113480]
MEIKVINAVKISLAPTNIPFCLVNEAALNYYNVPRVILAFIEGRSFNVIVLPDTLYHLDPLPNNIVQIQTYPPDQIRFSRQLDYSKDLNALSSIPIPRLATLLQGASQRYLESKVNAMAVCVEELVDGMNLDEAWCLDHLDTRKHRVMEFILDRIASQVFRISEFQPDNITIFVETEEEAQTLRMIPGYNELSWSREQQTQPKEMQMQNSDLPLTPGWLQSALLFLNAVMVNLKSAIFHQPSFHPVDFQYISDLHLEDGQLYETFVVPRTAPYLILAGDIGCLRNYKEYVTFLAAQCAQFGHVFITSSTRSPPTKMDSRQQKHLKLSHLCSANSLF